MDGRGSYDVHIRVGHDRGLLFAMGNAMSLRCNLQGVPRAATRTVVETSAKAVARPKTGAQLVRRGAGGSGDVFTGQESSGDEPEEVKLECPLCNTWSVRYGIFCPDYPVCRIPKQ